MELSRETLLKIANFSGPDEELDALISEAISAECKTEEGMIEALIQFTNLGEETSRLIAARKFSGWKSDVILN
ncbi:MAG TPA: hypothetical protein DDZ88_04720 [Verrucomicrobiales bacterium]|nr:hypothetical protein [Verrucomicrobiales bacterium]